MRTTRAPDVERFRDLYDRHERRGIVRSTETLTRLPGRWRTVPDGDGKWWIDWSDLSNPDLDVDIDDVIAEERAYGRSLGRELEWKLYDHDEPPDLRERLEAAGFVCEAAEAVVIAEVDEVHGSLRARSTRPDVHFRVRRPGPDGMHAVAHVLETVYDEPFDDLGRRLADQLASAPQEVDVVVIDVDDEPVAAGWSWYRDESPFATLWGGATVPSARGRGAYHALLAARLDEAKARGRTLASLDAGPMSRPILQRIGFVTVGWATPCVAQPS